jgi:hypothetical protein
MTHLYLFCHRSERQPCGSKIVTCIVLQAVSVNCAQFDVSGPHDSECVDLFFWVVMSCSIVGGYRRFSGIYRLDQQGLRMPSKRWSPPTRLHDVTPQKATQCAQFLCYLCLRVSDCVMFVVLSCFFLVFLDFLG